MQRLLMISLVALAAGCTSYRIESPARPIPAPPAPAPGLAEVCVVRPHTFANLVPVVVRDNGVLVGGTLGASYFCWQEVPGLHHIETESGDDVDRALGTAAHDRARVTAEPGRRYYLHQSLGNLYGISGLAWVDEATGRAMIDQCDYKLLRGVPGSEALPTGAPVAAAR
ncbi:MAG TPA: hypothetical protein VHB21_24370 [Minicystis sp.]|nr:hypothetical protein [Minicystis sp.]